MRQIIAAVLLAFVGLCIGGITAGITTLYIIGLGAVIGAPLGAALGGWIGWRTPLRDATVIFGCYFVVLGWASRHIALANSAEGVEHFRQLVIAAAIAGPGGFFIPQLPVRWLSFENRRVLGLILAPIWTLGLVMWVYLWLWVWNP